MKFTMDNTLKEIKAECHNRGLKTIGRKSVLLDYLSGKQDGQKKKSMTTIAKEAYLARGKVMPKCINPGCDRDVAIRRADMPPRDPSFKTECASCQSSRTQGKSAREGVTFHKKNYCENKDGMLGFKCPMDPSRYIEFPSDIYDMDHKDGDHHHNTCDNLITLCKICHTRKGKQSGDFNSWRKYSVRGDCK